MKPASGLRLLAALVALALVTIAPIGKSFAGNPAKTRHAQFSGIYPHLEISNRSDSESGIGAVAPWAGRLWFLTYPAHQWRGSPDKLYNLNKGLELAIRPESVGGTHANRMIHRESGQLIIGPYFIDKNGRVRVVKPQDMPGRLTATARHLTDPANKVFFCTMEEGLYEVDIHTLAVTLLCKDRNTSKDIADLLPGAHAKGAYTGQGRLIVTNNGSGGALAEWDGRGDPSRPGSWRIVDRNKFTDVTGPGGIYGAPSDESPVWAIGWDTRSVILKLLDDGHWYTYRLPKASYTHDADHGWFTEWPRIREVTGGRLLMNMHGLFYDFPKAFCRADAGGIRPISTFLKMVVDYADWDGRLVMAADDLSRQGNPLAGHPNSNLWFGSLDDLRAFGPAAGWGGPWLEDPVKAGVPSDPYLLGGAGGFRGRVVHLTHDNPSSVTFTLEIDRKGDGRWTEYAKIAVPAKGYAYHVMAPDVGGEWIRVKADTDIGAATAYFHYSAPGRPADADLIGALAKVGEKGPECEGLLKTSAGPGEITLGFAASATDASGQVVETGCYVVAGTMQFRRAENPAQEKEIRNGAATSKEFDEDDASVIVTDRDTAKKYRLPKGPARYSAPSASGWPRAIREVVTERSLMNVHGTFYELPRAASGGMARIRPVCTHGCGIFDFASWRGLLVLSGTRAGAKQDAHFVPSEDGKVGLWFGAVDDLWRFGKPRGRGGPWLNSSVQAGEPSDPYLLAGYDRKTLTLSHNQRETVTFTVEVDIAPQQTWCAYKQIKVPPGQTVSHEFPDGYSAHWLRLRVDRPCAATAQLVYE